MCFLGWEDLFVQGVGLQWVLGVLGQSLFAWIRWLGWRVADEQLCFVVFLLVTSVVMGLVLDVE